jgi:hypothetical protein
MAAHNTAQRRTTQLHLNRMQMGSCVSDIMGSSVFLS